MVRAADRGIDGVGISSAYLLGAGNSGGGTGGVAADAAGAKTKSTANRIRRPFLNNRLAAQCGPGCYPNPNLSGRYMVARGLVEPARERVQEHGSSEHRDGKK